MVRSVETQAQNFSFVGTDFTGQTDFIVVRHLATYKCLPSKNLFRLCDNLVNVSRTVESMSLYRFVEDVIGLHICIPIYGEHGLVFVVGLHKPTGL
jgi:hypothetical protein